MISTPLTLTQGYCKIYCLFVIYRAERQNPVNLSSIILMALDIYLVFLPKNLIPLSKRYFNHLQLFSIIQTNTSVVDRWFEARLYQTKDYKIDICCFSTKHTPLRRAKTGLFNIRIMFLSGATSLVAHSCFSDQSF